MIRHQVPETLKREELSRYIRRAWPLLPGHVLKNLLKKRDIRIGGIKSGKGDWVQGGDILEIYAPDTYFIQDVQIIFDDGSLLAAIKPQGLPSLPDADGVGADTMQARLQRSHPTARLCHRLDAATGGVMIAALNDTIQAQAFAAFKQHELGKTYRAILTKKPPRNAGVFRAHLTKDAKRSTVRISDRPLPQSREIVTRLQLRGEENGLWDAELEPVTGRTHQLRAHMAHLGCPILGDDKYGDREMNRDLGFVGRLCLWCEEMEIPNGSSLRDYAGKKFRAEAPLWLKK